MRNLVILFLLIAACGGFLLFWISAPEVFIASSKSSATTDTSADSYMKNIDTLSFNEQGQKASRVQAARADHFNAVDRMDFLQPVMTAFNTDNGGSGGSGKKEGTTDTTKGKAPWHMKSAKGSIFENGSRAEFTGNVFAWQKNGKIDNQVHTEKLTVYPEKHTAETQVRVSIVSEQGKTTGVGMRADLNAKRFKLLSKVKGVHYAR